MKYIFGHILTFWEKIQNFSFTFGTFSYFVIDFSLFRLKLYKNGFDFRVLFTVCKNKYIHEEEEECKKTAMISNF